MDRALGFNTFAVNLVYNQILALLTEARGDDYRDLKIALASVKSIKERYEK